MSGSPSARKIGRMSRLVDDLKREVRELTLEVYGLRSAIIALMPGRQQDVLAEANACDTLADVRDWEAWAVGQLTRIANESATQVHEVFSPEASCPLCGEKPVSRYSRGFTLPLGLERHLRGSHKSYQCAVFRAAAEGARAAARHREGNAFKPDLSGPGFTSRVPPWRTGPVGANVVELSRRTRDAG